METSKAKKSQIKEVLNVAKTDKKPEKKEQPQMAILQPYIENGETKVKKIIQ